MELTVYVLEVVQAGGAGAYRAHFAQTLGAAQRRASRHVTGGVWVTTSDPACPARLMDGERELARVVRQTVDPVSSYPVW